MINKSQLFNYSNKELKRFTSKKQDQSFASQPPEETSTLMWTKMQSQYDSQKQIDCVPEQKGLMITQNDVKVPKITIIKPADLPRIINRNALQQK